MNPAMFQPGYFPIQQNQRAFFPPAMTQMRQWQPSMNRTYNVPVQQQRGRGNVPRTSISGGMAARANNPSTQRTVGVQQRNQMAQNQAVQQQQAAAKLKFNANARNQPEAIATGNQGVVGGDRAQGMPVCMM